MRQNPPSITKRRRKRTLKSGRKIVHTRFVVNARDHMTGRRKQFFFFSLDEAVAKRDELIDYSGNMRLRTDMTVAEAVRYWLDNRRGAIKNVTWRDYKYAAEAYIIGPLLVGSKQQRQKFAMSGRRFAAGPMLQMLGHIPVEHLTTAHIRAWHKSVAEQVSIHTASLAKKFLKATLALVAEDFSIRVPSLPTNLGRGRARPRKAILSPDQVNSVLQAARVDERRGIYYAFPFLTGVRPSEQLALFWDDVDMMGRAIAIRRVQERDGTLSEITKTAAGFRRLPMSPLLHSLLVEWQARCPRLPHGPARVFPAENGGRLWYAAFRTRYWHPALRTLGMPPVTPHSARHTFISTLQSKGIEVGLVAKLAGHANATVTLSHYTHAIGHGEAALQALEKAFRVTEIGDRGRNPLR